MESLKKDSILILNLFQLPFTRPCIARRGVIRLKLALLFGLHGRYVGHGVGGEHLVVGVRENACHFGKQLLVFLFNLGAPI